MLTILVSLVTSAVKKQVDLKTALKCFHRCPILFMRLDFSEESCKDRDTNLNIPKERFYML